MKLNKKKIWQSSVENFFHASSLLPMWFHHLLASLMFPIVCYVLRYRRSTIRQNLAAAFPEKTQRERRRIERQFYRFFCDYIVETCKLFTIRPNHIRRRMTFEGIEAMERSLDDHDFVFVYLGHYCNWEWISTLPLWVSPSYHLAQLYRPLKDEAFDHLFTRLRTRFGAENISKYDALRRILSLKAEGRKSIIGFISDQSPKPGSIHDWVTFLNQETPVFTGTERIAKKVGAAVYFADVKRIGRGRYHCVMRPMKETATDEPGYALTEDYMVRLEEMIRRQPPFWLWSHKRWKHKRSEVEAAAK